MRKKVLPIPCEKLMIFLGFVFVTNKHWKCRRERDATLTWGRQHKNRKSGPDYSARSRACFHVELSLLNQSTESIAELQSNYNPIDFDTLFELSPTSAYYGVIGKKSLSYFSWFQSVVFWLEVRDIILIMLAALIVNAFCSLSDLT